MAWPSSDTVGLRILEMYNYFKELEESPSVAKKSITESIQHRIAGNTLYYKTPHTEAEHVHLISLYTKTIAYAPLNSEQMAKGYGNRAAALMHIKLYKEALLDIMRGMMYWQSPEYHKKLIERRDRCLIQMQKFPDDRLTPEEIPAITPSSFSPNVSEAVKVGYSDNLKRQIFVAARDIDAGEFIVTDKRYTCYPNKDMLYISCTHCLKFAWNAIPCDKCVFAVFCSEQCKSKAMEEYHDVECPMAVEIHTVIQLPPWDPSVELFDNFTNTMLVIRLFIKAVKKQGFQSVIKDIKTSDKETDDTRKLLSNGILDFEKFKYLFNLPRSAQVEHYMPTKNADYVLGEEPNLCWSNYNNSIAVVTSILRHTNFIPVRRFQNFFNAKEKKLLTKLVKAFMRLHNIIKSNFYWYEITSFYDENEGQVKHVDLRGNIYSPIYNLFNHSCCNNAANVYVPNHCNAIYTTVPVKKGQQLFINYGRNISVSKEVRQKYYQEQYDFFCTCQACKENWDFGKRTLIIKIIMPKTPQMKKAEIEYRQKFPDETTFLTPEVLPENPSIEKIIFASKLIHKYFGYHNAYLFCLAYSIVINESYTYERFGEIRFKLDDCQV